MRILLATTFVALVAVTAAIAATPTLRVVDRSPLVVRGTGFKPGEHVRVWLVLTTARRSRDALAGTTGGFTVRFTVTPLQCPFVRSLTATGSRGSRAALKLPPSMCPQPPVEP